MRKKIYIYETDALFVHICVSTKKLRLPYSLVGYGFTLEKAILRAAKIVRKGGNSFTATFICADEQLDKELSCVVDKHNRIHVKIQNMEAYYLDNGIAPATKRALLESLPYKLGTLEESNLCEYLAMKSSETIAWWRKALSGKTYEEALPLVKKYIDL